ncbi:hypothetical protein BXY75_1454 [Ulvibacter antarcticus]|uniref:Uncharacterized protein n=1 Tax=Ulvibacter antarcticus TaxID=442714 RepID=A0A3L9Z2K8_9FLAO|nr:hypothetical protein BXY75_1454 [Ulvibacter antarcticus]
MKNTTKKEIIIEKFVWKRSFTVVLLLNAAYIVLFYFLMQRYS